MNLDQPNDVTVVTNSEFGNVFSLGPPSLPIRLCGKFLEDPIFQNIVPTLPKKWLKNLKLTCKLGPSLGIRNMDNLNFGKDKFQVVIDCKGFISGDINCTVLTDTVTLIAEHSNGGRTTKLSRSYDLPESVDPKLAVFQLSEEGIAVVTVPWLG